MTDGLQSNRALTCVPQRSSHLLGYDRLPVYAESGEEYRILWCLVEGDYCEPFKVNSPINIDIDDLKELIRAKGVGTSVLPKDLVLWKLTESEPFEPDDTFTTRVRTKISNLSKVATQARSWNKVSVLFPQQTPQDCLRIIIQMSLRPHPQKRSNSGTAESNNYPFKRPRSSDMLDEVSHLTVPYPGSFPEQCPLLDLNCVVYGDSTTSIFIVHIEAPQTVAALKDAVMEQNKNSFQHIDTKTLKIWKVSLPIDDTSEENVGMPDGKALLPVVKLSTLFPEPPDWNHIHIIVKSPAIGVDNLHQAPRKVSEFDETPDPNLVGLHLLFWGIAPSDCWKEHTVPIPDIRTLSVEHVRPSKFTTITLRNGIKFPFGEPDFLVTSVYEEFWGLITADEKEWQAAQKARQPFATSYHATIIKGQPGIGKAVFLSYVLVRRLQARLPTVYCDSNEYVHIFGDSGVIKVQLTPGSRISELDNNAQCCALVNIGGTVEQPPLQFFPRTRKGRVVVATSPNLAHVKAFLKEWPSISYCMPTWDDGTGPNFILPGNLLLKGTLNLVDTIHSENLREVFTKYRGVPRLCLFQCLHVPIRQYESTVQTAIDNIPSIDELIASVQGPLPFKDKTSHRLVTIVPNKSRIETSTEITSPYIVRLLFKKFANFKMYKVSRSIKSLLAQNESRAEGGVLFEQAVHRVFCKGITFQAQGISTNAPHLEVSIRAHDQEESYFFHLQVTRAAPGSQKIGESYRNRYLIPVLKNQESINSVWLSETCTVIFQITVSNRHPLKSHEIKTLIDELPDKAKRDIRIVFIIPSGDEEMLPFQEQLSERETGEAKEFAENFQKYPQYVYPFDIDSLNTTCDS